jgi:DNA-binding CsgD family transcriptional regulator
MKLASLRAQIRQLCCLGLPAETLMPRLLPMLRTLVPADSAGFFWVDAGGHMRNLYAERMLPMDRSQLYFKRFYDSDEHPFRRQFVERMERARAGENVTSVSADESLQRTAYYNEIMRELDAHHVMYGVVRDHGGAIGQLSLYRSRTSREFDANERAELNNTLRYVAHAVAAPGVEAGMPAGEKLLAAMPGIPRYVDTEDEAVAVVDAAGTLLHGSDQLKRLLVQAVDGSFVPDPKFSSDGAVQNMLGQLLRMLRDAGDAPPVLVRDTRWGRLQLRAYHLDEHGAESAPVAIRVLRQEPLLLKLAEAMQSLGLAPQQQEIALLLARGMTNPEIAVEMGVSPNTVSYHIKQLFQKLDAHGRGEAVAKILGSGTTRG